VAGVRQSPVACAEEDTYSVVVLAAASTSDSDSAKQSNNILLQHLSTPRAFFGRSQFESGGSQSIVARKLAAKVCRATLSRSRAAHLFDSLTPDRETEEMKGPYGKQDSRKKN
jgi:hypothetical protein